MIKIINHIIYTRIDTEHDSSAQWQDFVDTLSENANSELKAAIVIICINESSATINDQINNWLRIFEPLLLPLGIVGAGAALEQFGDEFHLVHCTGVLENKPEANIPVEWIELLQSRPIHLIRTITKTLNKSTALTFDESAIYESDLFSQLLWQQWNTAR